MHHLYSINDRHSRVDLSNFMILFNGTCLGRAWYWDWNGDNGPMEIGVLPLFFFVYDNEKKILLSSI